MKGHFNAVLGEAKYRQRKFLLSCFAMWVITLGLFTDKLGGGEFNAALFVVLGMYGTQAFFGSKDDRHGEQE